MKISLGASGKSAIRLIAFLAGTALLAACDSGNGPDGKVGKDLVGCWDLVKVDSRKAGGQRLVLAGSDSAYFHFEGILFSDTTTGVNLIQDEIAIGFSHWDLANDSLTLQGGSGTLILTYPDSSIRVTPVPAISEKFALNSESGRMDLKGSWLGDTTLRVYGYQRCP